MSCPTRVMIRPRMAASPTLTMMVASMTADQKTSPGTSRFGIDTSTTCCMMSGAVRPMPADRALSTKAMTIGFRCFRT